jgi:hypothetical protein
VDAGVEVEIERPFAPAQVERGAPEAKVRGRLSLEPRRGEHAGQEDGGSEGARKRGHRPVR